MPTLYEDLVAAGLEVSNWQPDLYVPATEEAKEIFRGHQQAPCYFRSNINGSWMLEAPFQFDPYWQKEARDDSMHLRCLQLPIKLGGICSP